MRHLPGRHVAEVLLDERGSARDRHVAGDRQHCVTGRVVGVEEARRVGKSRRLQLLERAITVVGVGKRGVRDGGQPDPGKPAVRAVHHVDPDLLLDDRDLVFEVLLGQFRGAHPVGLEEERELERSGWQQLEVVRVVGMGRAVERAAGGLHVFGMLGLPDVLRALEHEVLEEVGEAGAVGRLAAEAHVVVDGDGHDGCGAIRRDDDAQAVRQGETLDLIGGRGGAATGARRAGGAGAGGEGLAWPVRGVLWAAQ